jgi:hypothetical protein
MWSGRVEPSGQDNFPRLALCALLPGHNLDGVRKVSKEEGSDGSAMIYQ